MSPAERMAKRKPKIESGAIKAVWVCRVREIRESLGLSQRDVGRGAGVNYSILCRIEYGADLTLTTATKLMKFFGKTIDELWPKRI